MTWALISTVVQELSYWSKPTLDAEGNTIVGPQWVTESVPIGTILNLVVYDGLTEYTPPNGTRIAQVPDTAAIGDTGYTLT